jgi:HEAT repeat protein
MYRDVVLLWIAIFRTLFANEFREQMWIADLADDDPDTASDAAVELGLAESRQAVPALMALLTLLADETDAEQVDLRQDVVRALGRIGDERAIPLLKDVATNDADRGIRDEAIHALQSWP